MNFSSQPPHHHTLLPSSTSPQPTPPPVQAATPGHKSEGPWVCFNSERATPLGLKMSQVHQGAQSPIRGLFVWNFYPIPAT